MISSILFYVFFVLLAGCATGLFYCLLMMYRNQLVYNFRTKVLSQCKDGNFEVYDNLPPYEGIMNNLTLWDFDKLLQNKDK